MSVLEQMIAEQSEQRAPAPILMSEQQPEQDARCLTAALDYQRRGWSVVAIHATDPETGKCTCQRPNCNSPGKHVIGGWKEWQERRRTANAVETLFKKHPDAGVGVILDASGVAVIDVDGPQGVASLQAMVDERMLCTADIKSAPRSKSGRADGGTHLWFKLPKDGPRSRKHGCSPKIDILSAGLVVMPPSRHASGKEYEWVRGLDDAQLPALPAGIEAILREAEKPATEAKDQSPAPGATIDAKRYVYEFIECLANPKFAVEGVGNRDNMLATHIVPLGKAFGLSKPLLVKIIRDHWFGIEDRCPVTDDYDLDHEVARKYDNVNSTRPGEKQRGAEQVAAGMLKPDEVPAEPVWGDPEPEATVEEDAAVGELPPLTPDEWASRDLPEPDYLLGHWLHTTSRALIVGATGVGKTNFGLALAAHMAAGQPFLQWPARRQARVLYIDGEMSNRLLKQRVADACRRLGYKPRTLFTLSHEDVKDPPGKDNPTGGLAPLNTAAGQSYIERLIKRLGGVDFVMFDNIMSLLGGEMRETEPWAKALPWILSLTKRGVGQVWFHHTGHDESRSYGDKTREWGLDTVIHLTGAKRDGIDVSFDLVFRKARERTPDNRAEFADIRVSLEADEWTWQEAERRKAGKVSQIDEAFRMALEEALADPADRLDGHPAVTMEQWKAVCERTGLIDPGAKPDAARALFSRHRRNLIGAGLVIAENELARLMIGGARPDADSEDWGLDEERLQ